MEKEIKEVYKELDKIENIYVIPISVYNEIIKKIEYFDEALKNSRKSRDVWKKKYMELKNEL